VRQGFREIATAEPERCVLLDGSGDVTAVHTAVMTAVWTRLGVSTTVLPARPAPSGRP
jgi:dTMP kinase